MKYEKIKEYKEEKFRRITGLKKKTYEKCVEILKAKYREEHIKNVRKSGRKSKLTIEDKLLATLEYLREYRTYAHIAASYGVHESQIVRYVKWVETTLIKKGTFRLPGKKELLKPDAQYEIVLVDSTESPIERPKRGQKFYYSGKKKRHTIKSQIVVNKSDKTIICTAFSNGKCHDFRLFKESKVFINKNIKLLADTGFQGITHIHENSQTPEKNSKNFPLTKTQKLNNRKISGLRIYVEHSISFIKRFKILSQRYRNRRKRFTLRFNLISSFCNYELLL